MRDTKSLIRAIEEKPISRFHFENFIKPYFPDNPHIDENLTENDNPEEHSTPQWKTPQWILDAEERLRKDLGDRLRVNTRPKDLVEVLFFENPKSSPYKSPFKKREE